MRVINPNGSIGSRVIERTKYQPGNSSMLIFLGKNLLGQRDKVDTGLLIPNFIIIGDTDPNATEEPVE